MGVVAENADRVVVMYAGRKVEEANVDDLFERPGHPYTRGLLGSIPNLDLAARADPSRHRLNEIKGMVPSLFNLPQGCSFAPRCGFATDQCRAAYPPLEQHRPGPLGRLLARRAPAGRRRMSAAARGPGSQEAFPGLQGRVLARLRPCPCGGWRVVPHRPRRNAGPGRRERLRQIDGRPHAAEAARADRGHDPGPRQGHHRSRYARRCFRTASRCR